MALASSFWGWRMDKLTEIIEQVKSGELSEADGVKELEKSYRGQAAWRQRMEMPSGLMEEHWYDGMGVVLQHEFERAVLALVNQLPPQQAKCVEMYYLKGYKQEDIAESLGITQGRVAQLLSAARENISRFLRHPLIKRPISPLYSEGHYETPSLIARKVRRLFFLFQYYDRDELLAYCQDSFDDDNTVLPRWY